MTAVHLQRKIRELCTSGATLLWLEGAKHETVIGVKLSGNRLVLQLHGNVLRMVRFDRYTVTKVGLQFWLKDKPGVLYRWDQVPSGTQSKEVPPVLDEIRPRTYGFDDEPPPNTAA